jgi:hypothetical protein
LRQFLGESGTYDVVFDLAPGSAITDIYTRYQPEVQSPQDPIPYEVLGPTFLNKDLPLLDLPVKLAEQFKSFNQGYTRGISGGTEPAYYRMLDVSWVRMIDPCWYDHPKCLPKIKIIPTWPPDDPWPPNCPVCGIKFHFFKKGDDLSNPSIQSILVQDFPFYKETAIDLPPDLLEEGTYDIFIEPVGQDFGISGIHIPVASP